MVIDPNEYVWCPMEPSEYALETEGVFSFDGEGRRIYMIEVFGVSEGTVSVYSGEEKSELIGSVTFPDTKIEPSIPVHVDSLYLSGDGIAEGVSITFYCERGYQKSGIEEYLNSTEGMTCVRNTANDDTTDTITGVDWFRFNGNVANNIYVSGNHWIGFGSNSEQLKVCRRDGKVYYEYKQEGVLNNGTRFLKLRWEGYTQYNSTDVSRRLIFELFLFDTNDMFLNVVQTPTDSSFYGTSQFISNGGTIALNICDGSGGGQKICFYHGDETGNNWTVDYGDYVQTDIYTEAYLIRSENVFYSVIDGELAEVDVTAPTSANFYRYGTREIPDGALLLNLVNPDVLLWTNSPSESIRLKADITAYPYPQILTGYADMSSHTILGIRLLTAEYSGTVGVRISYDGGNTYEEEQTIDTFLNMDVDTLWQNCQAEKSLYIQFVLYNGAKFTRFKITYQN